MAKVILSTFYQIIINQYNYNYQYLTGIIHCHKGVKMNKLDHEFRPRFKKMDGRLHQAPA